MTDHDFFAAMAVDIPRIARPTRIGLDLATGRFMLPGHSRGQESIRRAPAANSSHCSVLEEKQLLSGAVEFLRYVLCNFDLPLLTVLLEGKSPFRDSSRSPNDGSPLTHSIPAKTQQQRLSRNADRLQLFGRRNDKSDCCLVPIAMRHPGVGPNRLDFVKKPATEFAQQALSNHFSPCVRPPLAEEGDNSKPQCHYSGHDGSYRRPSVPIRKAIWAQHPTLSDAIQHAHSLIPLWTRRHSATARAPEVCSA